MARHGHVNSFTGEGTFGSFRMSRSSYNFVKNNYVVYPEGLNGEDPNPYAVTQANYVKNSMSYQSENKLTGLDYLYYFIEDLAKKERKKELSLIKGEIAMLQKQKKSSFFKSTHTLKALNEIVSALETEPNYDTWRADESISSAFTLLLNPLGYDEIIRELHSENNTRGAQAMNDFFAGKKCNDIFNEIYPKFEEKFKRYFSVQTGGKLTVNGTQKIMNNLTEDFIQQFTDGLAKKLLQGQKEQVKYQETLTSMLKRVFGNNGFYFDDDAIKSKRIRKKYSLGEETLTEEEIEELKKTVKDRIKRTTEITHKPRDINTIIRNMCYNSVSNVIWKFAEMMPASNRGKIIGMGFDHMGDQQILRKSYEDTVTDARLYNVPGINQTHSATSTTDSLLEFTIFDTDTKQITDPLQKKGKKKIANREQLTKDIEKELEAQKEDALKIKELFKVEVNTKGYTTGNDLEVVNSRDLNSLSGNLKDLANNFYKLAGISPNSDEIYRNNRLGLVFDSLIFMLNNTVKQAAFSSAEDKEMVKQLISAVCVNWMWNGMTGIMKEIDSKEVGDATHIHLFQSGGAYFTSSDLLFQVLNILKKNFTYGPTVNNTNDYMSVSISSASFDPSATYKELQERFPLTTTKITRTGKRKFEKSTEKLDYEGRQRQLENRWTAIRNLSMSEVKLRINFRQQALDELLGRLSMLRNPK